MGEVNIPNRVGRGQCGASLIEMIIVIAVVSSVVLFIAGALLTLVKSSRSTEVTTQLESAITSYSEYLDNAGYSGDCDSPGDFATVSPVFEPGVRAVLGAWEVPYRIGVSVTEVEYWDRDSEVYTTSCPDDGARRLTVSATLDGVTRTAEVVQRDPARKP